MKTKIMLTASLIGLLAVTFVYGQQGLLKSKIDFPFLVGDKLLPAGQYEFIPVSKETLFRVTDGDKNTATVQILTRLGGAIHTTPQDAHLVFDMVENTYCLSEIWFPGEDGYLVLATKEGHEHKVIDVQR